MTNTTFTLANAAELLEDGTYLGFISERPGSTGHTFGIVSGATARTMLDKSTHPELLAFQLCQ